MKFSNSTWLFPAMIVATPLWFGIRHAAHANDAEAPPPAPFVIDHGILRVPDGSPLRTRLVVRPVDVARTPHQVIVPGQVDADPSHTVNILSPLTGRVQVLKVDVGDTVRKGQLLAVIASGDMAQAYSDYDKARDALDLANKTLARTRDVQQTGAEAVKDIEAAQSGVTQAEAEYARARTRLESLSGTPGAGASAHQLDIAAPIDGVVTALNVGQGGNVDDPTAAMMTVTDISTVWVTAEIAENLVGTIHDGDDAEVRLPAYPGAVLHGKVSSMTSVLAADTRRLPIHIAFNNADGHLLPNMFADVAIDVPQQTQVEVPQSALLMNNDDTTVLVEVSPWAFQRRKVELGDDEGDLVRVSSGLEPGERVVVQGGVLT
ncbi:MAG: efflux RND transporter periplasmic adaptor subunit, partial [Pararobbsia sp.]